MAFCSASGTWQDLLPWARGVGMPSCFIDTWPPALLLGGALLLLFASLASTGEPKMIASRVWQVLHFILAILAAVSEGCVLAAGIIRLASCAGDDCPGVAEPLAAGELLFAWLIIAAVVLKMPGGVPSDGLRTWWIASAVLSCVRVASVWPIHAEWANGENLAPQGLACTAVAAVAAALLGMLQRTEPLPEYDGVGNTPPPSLGWPSPQQGCSWMSQLYFGWAGPVLEAGRQKALNHGALYGLMDAENTELNRQLVTSLWTPRVQAWLSSHPEARYTHRGPAETPDSDTAKATVAAKKKAPSLARVMHDAYAFFFWSSGFLKVTSLAQLAQPLLLKRLVDFTLEPEPSLQHGIHLVLMLMGAAILASLSTNHYNFRMSRLGVRLRGSLCMLVYEKAMKLHPDELAARGSGQIASLLNIDVNNLSWAMPTVHELWATPLQLAACLFLLYRQIGWAAFMGLAVMAFMAPPNVLCMAALFRNQRRIMTSRDQRIRFLTEVMGSIKAVKLMTWEGHLMQKLGLKREEEVKSVRDQALMFAASGFLWLVTPVLVSTISFLVFCWTGGILTAPQAFAALSLFSILRAPLSGLPRVLQMLVQASVALRRLESFLLAKEVVQREALEAGPDPFLAEGDEEGADDAQCVAAQSFELPALHNPDAVVFSRTKNALMLIEQGQPLVKIVDGIFRWTSLTSESSDKKKKKRSCLPCGRKNQESELERPLLAGSSSEGQASTGSISSLASVERGPTLKDINFSVKAGEIVAVVGPVGTGKSSLLSAILNEISCESGSVSLAGKVAYCPQQPWIMNATLRENVLFGRDFEPEWYGTVLRACQLQPDLAILPGGDMAEIGEKGLNLSGGQKARVSLARAVYCRPDVILLDDVLSAVDVHVATALLDECLLNPDLLGHAARVVVSHQLFWLESATRVDMMEAGRIVASGTAEELSDSGLLSFARRKEKSARRGLFGRIGRRGRKSGQVVAKGSTYAGSSYAGSVASTSASALATPTVSEVTEGDVGRVSELEDVPDGKGAANKVGEGQEITIAEDREEGAVAAGIWKLYIRQLGIGYVVVFALLLLLSQGAQVLGDTTLAIWTSGLSHHPEKGHYAPLVFYTGAAFLSVGIMYLRSLVLVFASIRACKRVHDAALWRVLRAPLTWLDATPNGRIINRFQSDQQKVDLMLPATMGNVLASAAAMFASVVVVCVTAPAAILLLPPVTILFLRFQGTYRCSSREVMRLSSISSSKLYHFFGESLEGSSTIRAFGRQEEFVRLMEERIQNLQRPQYLDRTIDKWLALRLDALGNSAVAMAALYGVIGHCLGVATTSSTTVGLSLTYSFSLTSMMSILLMSFAFAETSLVSMERLHAYATLESEPKLRGATTEATDSTPEGEDSPNEAQVIESKMRCWSRLGIEQSMVTSDGHSPAATATVPGPQEQTDPPGWPACGNLSFNGVCMRYRPGLDLVLHDLTFSVPHGQHVGIVGRTGAGKSSLLGVLFRLVEIESGSIELDGQDIRSVGLHTLRENMSIIPQEPVLFSGTLRFNIDPWGTHSDETLLSCLRRVGLWDLVEDRGQGLSMAIGPNGDNMSVGQRQLLCMARALLRDTKVVVLDEATASIDSESDAQIQKVLAEELQGATVLTIAHRINTVMSYDMIMVMAAGKVVEMGPPMELAKRSSSMFHGLYKAAKAQGQEK